MQRIFEGHVQCHQHCTEDFWEQLFVYAGISVVLCCSVNQMPFTYQKSGHLSGHHVQIPEMNYCISKYKEQKGPVSLLHPGLQSSKGGNLDVGGEGSSTKAGSVKGLLPVWVQQKYDLLLWLCLSFCKSLGGIRCFCIYCKWWVFSRTQSHKLADLSNDGENSLLTPKTGVETIQKNF